MLTCPTCRKTFAPGVETCPDDGATLLPAEVLGTVDAPLEPGTMVGEYRIDRKLGAGTFGDVYAGEQPLIGKRVAVKLLHRKLSSEAEVVSRFIAEARAVNRIRHRNIIDIFSFGVLPDKRQYFVMELLDGLTLGELIRRERRLSPEKALPIFKGIASGLDAAHEAGITHRDLKPDNVFLAVEKDGSYFPKLLDFGVAKLGGEDVAHKTATGMAIGTPRYMSPEQCRGKKIDSRADIYSLGVVLHEALTGEPLFEGESAMDVLFKHMNDPPAPMSSVCSDLPALLDAPVLAMLAKRPKDRPATAGEAVAALIEAAKQAGQIASLDLPPSGSSQEPRSDAAPLGLRPAPPAATTMRMPNRAKNEESSSVSRSGGAVASAPISTSPDSHNVDVTAATAISSPLGSAAASLGEGVSTLESAYAAPAAPAPSSPAMTVSGPSPRGADRLSGGPGSTEIAPASRASDTLIDVAATSGAARPSVAVPPAKTRPKRSAAPIAVGILLAAGAGVALFLSKSAPPNEPTAASATTATTLASATASTATPHMEGPATGVVPVASITADPAPPLASGSAPATAKSATPARSASTGKPIASDVHRDLDIPKETLPGPPATQKRP